MVSDASRAAPRNGDIASTINELSRSDARRYHGAVATRWHIGCYVETQVGRLNST